jgi:SAM-dependent methyltransferase
METVNCNLCDSSSLRRVYRMPDLLFHPDEWFDVVECTSCGLGFTNPRPSRTEMARYYPPAFYHYFEENAAFHARRYAMEARFLEGTPGANRRLLDVGCANGDFPRHMAAQGWSVTGVEVSESAKPIEDFPVFRCELTEVPLDEPSFDAITAWAVIEHVHDPLAYFRKAARLLKPGGRFVFLVTNFESWASHHLFREDLPRHLYFFSEATVRRYMQRVGLQLEQADYSNDIYAIRCVNWLRYCFYRVVLRRPMNWPDLPERPQAYFERMGRADPLTKIKYVLQHPFAVIDRALLPLFELLAPKRLTMGAVVFVATKPHAAERST